MSKIIPTLLAIVLIGCGGGGPTNPTSTIPPSDNGGDGTQPKPETRPPAQMEMPAPPPTNVDRLPFPFDGVTSQYRAFRQSSHYATFAQLPSDATLAGFGVTRRADVKHQPIYTDGVFYFMDGSTLNSPVQSPRVFVGTDQSAENIKRLPAIGGRRDTEIRYGPLNDGLGRTQIVNFLLDAGLEDHFTKRWLQPPVVRLAGNLDGISENVFAAAVRLVNTALPERNKLSMGDSLPGRSFKHLSIDIGIGITTLEPQIQSLYQLPANTIVIEPGYAGDIPESAAGVTTFLFEDNKVQRSLIVIDQDHATFQSERNAVIALAHELMHALGFLDPHHIRESYNSILKGSSSIYNTVQNGQQQPISLLYPIDREALRALYTLNPGDNPLQLGVWSSTSMHIHGNGPHAGFGVAMRNGYAEPYAYGYLSPVTGPNGNPGLSGNVRWSGDLVGFTPGSNAVTGDAAIILEIGTLTGKAEFTALEQWNAAPGKPGSGVMWEDGDLAYTIAVRGNTFRDSGGDNGTLTGIWTGAGHEGVAGTLERTDLTAAFGGVRKN